MKFLLVLAVVVVAIWVWRNNRQGESQAANPRPPKGTALPLAMVECLVCGTHLPESDALKGAKGLYCCTEHRSAHDAARP